MESRVSLLFFVLVLLTGAAAAVLVTEEARSESPHAEAFQRLVGGLGFGPAVDPCGDTCRFDPRLDGSYAEDLGPIPGGSYYQTRRADSIFYYPPIRRRSEESGDDALSP